MDNFWNNENPLSELSDDIEICVIDSLRND